MKLVLFIAKIKKIYFNNNIESVRHYLPGARFF